MQALEEIDLAVLAHDLASVFGSRPPHGYLTGKTVFRDALVSSLACSELTAEELVDTLISQGFLAYPLGPDAPAADELARWRFPKTAS